MNDPKDMVQEILSDPDKLSSIMSMASSFLGGSSQPSKDESTIHTSDTFTNSNNSASNNANSTNNVNFGEFGEFDILTKAMPFITNIMKNSEVIDSSKKNLISAISPFTPNNISSQMQNSVRLIGLAKMAKTALNEFGKKG